MLAFLAGLEKIRMTDECEQAARHRRQNLPLYLGIRFVGEAAAMVQSVAVGWTVYSVSNTPFIAREFAARAG